MKRTILLTVLAVLAVTGIFVEGYGQTTAMVDQRDKAEKNTGKFNPGYWNQDKTRHLAFRLTYMQDSSFQVAAIELRNGGMPYRSTTGGEIRISFRDSRNSVLGSYYTTDPINLRSCDTENHHFQSIPAGTVIEIYTPYLPEIKSIEIENAARKTVRRIIVEPHMKAAGIVVQ
jgi:hypothetical protein